MEAILNLKLFFYKIWLKILRKFPQENTIFPLNNFFFNRENP